MRKKTTGSGHRINRVRSIHRLAYRAIIPLALLLSVVVIPLTIGAVAPRLAPSSASFPGKRTLENPGGEIPRLAQAFAPFRERLGISRDENFLYVEGNQTLRQNGHFQRHPGNHHEPMAEICDGHEQIPQPRRRNRRTLVHAATTA